MGSGGTHLAITTKPAEDRTKDPASDSEYACYLCLTERSDRGSHVEPYPTFERYMRSFKPIELLVPVSCTRYRASTSGLSTWWSTTALRGELVLRGASRLDAFSGYPVRT